MRGIFVGAIIVVGMRWTDRLAGFVSTLVLARLLVPDDYGVVAMASIFVGLIDVLLDLGVASALIQKGNCDSHDYSTAWTLRLMQAVFAAVLIVLAAPLVAEYFRDSRITGILYVMGVAVLIGGLENIGVVAFQVQMDFARDFRFFFVRRMISLIVTLGLAWWLQSYWALAFGSLAGRVAGVILSYTMHPFRPRLSLDRFRAFWTISQWLLLRGVGLYFNNRIDKVIIGRTMDAATVGAYSLADEIAAMPSTELLAPLGRVLFPAFVNARNESLALKRAFLLATAVQAMIALPASVGLALVASLAVPVLLGHGWIGATPFIQLLALVYGVTAIYHAASYVLLTLGHVVRLTLITWLQVGLFAAAALALPLSGGAQSIAELRLAIAIFAAICIVASIVFLVPSLKLADILAALWRPAAATCIMALVVLELTISLTPWIALVLTCGIGACVYVSALAGLWILVGRPQGGEAYLIEKVLLSLRSVRART